MADGHAAMREPRMRARSRKNFTVPPGGTPPWFHVEPTADSACGPLNPRKIWYRSVLGGALGRRLKPSDEAAIPQAEGPTKPQSMLPNLHAPPVADGALPVCRPAGCLVCDMRASY